MQVTHLGAIASMEDLDTLRKQVLKLRLKSDLKNQQLLKIIANFATSGKLYEEPERLLGKDDSLDFDPNIYLKQFGLSYKFLLDDDYPPNLKLMKSPPAILFFKGTWSKEIFYKTISIVGTRTPTHYGKDITKTLTSALSNNSFTIVSGMAFGIDREAHLAALDSNGRTIAVLASSPNQPTPSNNSDLYNRILENGGLVISDVAPGEEVQRSSFVARNRIVAALSDATLVIEAGEKSGALITAELAWKSKKFVFAIPGNINSSVSMGTNNLIKESKARLITTIGDILNAMDMTENSSEFISQNLKNLTDKEINTYNALIESMYVEEVSSNINCDISDTLTTLTSLELKGYIVLTTEGKYKKIANLTK